jgi:hypothetical protein
LYDEAMALIEAMQRDFSPFIEIESIGKTYENRDIPMLKIKFNPE